VEYCDDRNSSGCDDDDESVRIISLFAWLGFGLVGVVISFWDFGLAISPFLVWVDAGVLLLGGKRMILWHNTSCLLLCHFLYMFFSLLLLKQFVVLSLFGYEKSYELYFFSDLGI